MQGGRPPAEVEMELCDIGTVFMKLMQIKGNDDCRAGWRDGNARCRVLVVVADSGEGPDHAH